MRHYVYKLICWKFVEVNLKAGVVDGSNKCRLSLRRPMLVSVWIQTETKPLLESLSLKLHMKCGRRSGLKSAKELQREYMATLCTFLPTYTWPISYQLSVFEKLQNSSELAPPNPTSERWVGMGVPALFNNLRSTLFEAYWHLNNAHTFKLLLQGDFCNFIRLVKVKREWCISDSRVLTVSHQSSLGSADSPGPSVI